MHNWKLKLLSLVSAILLWLVVVGINDPIRTFTFSGIHVDVVNSSAITSEGKVYEVLDDSDVITIQVKARRSAALSDTDFKAVANMQDIQLMKYVPINISCTKNVNIQSITTKTPNLKISIEDSDTKTLPIVVRTNGTPGAGYIIDKNNTIASPESVRITGAASAIRKISRVYAEVDVSGITKDTERITSLSLYNGDGDSIKNSSLTYNIDTNSIDISIKLLKTKEVPVKASVSGRAADGYAYTKVSCEPSTITLAGKEDVLKNVTAIEIPASDVDISQATADVEKVVDISAYLPANTQLEEEESATVAVTVAVEKLEERTVTLEKSRISLENVPDGYQASFLTTTDLSFTVRGRRASMEMLDTSQWTGQIDLSEYKKADTYEVPVTINLPDGYELPDTPIAVVKIEKDTAN